MKSYKATNIRQYFFVRMFKCRPFSRVSASVTSARYVFTDFHFFELQQIGTFAYNHHATLTMKFVFVIYVSI